MSSIVRPITARRPRLAGRSERLLQTPRQGRDGVLQPLEALLQLDDLLGHARHLRARRKVEGLQGGLDGLLGQALGRRLAHQPLVEGLAHHLGEGLRAHGLAERLRPGLDGLVEELLPLGRSARG